MWLAAQDKTHARRVFKFCFEAARVRGLKREVVLLRVLRERLGERRDIAQILDWEFDHPPFFLETAYTEAGDLLAWAKGKGGIDQVPLADRIEIAAQAAEALAAAHHAGVLHKDLKPSNLLISDADQSGGARVCLTDFGIGLVTSREALSAAGITVGGLTETLLSSSSTTGAGTRLYMAPEVIEGGPATERSDLYGLGVVLYQMVIGDFRRALAPGWERAVADEELREDIAACVDGDARVVSRARRSLQRDCGASNGGGPSGTNASADGLLRRHRGGGVASSWSRLPLFCCFSSSAPFSCASSAHCAASARAPSRCAGRARRRCRRSRG